jgi:hypothetical protein
MTVYEAIRRMRELSVAHKSFALSFMSYSRTRRESHGIVEVEHAILVKNEKKNIEGMDMQEYMLTFRDQDTGEARHFWQPLLLSFNHEELTSIS